MRHVSKSKLVFIMLAGVLAGTLFWNGAAHAEDKTITAHIEMDRQLGTTKIEDDADADARVVIDGLQDNPDQNAPGAEFTYSWSLTTTGLPVTLPDVDAKSNTISTSFDTAGEYDIQFKVVIDFDPGTGDDHWHGVATGEVTQDVIGGPINGDTLALFYCTTDSPLFDASVGDTQPAGTTYTWSVSNGGAGQIEFMDPNTYAPVTSWSGTDGKYSQIHFRGRAGSNPGNGDVMLKVIYSKEGVSANSNTLIIFVSKPSELNDYQQNYADSNHIYYKNDPVGNSRWYGFGDGTDAGSQNIQWQLLNQNGEGMNNVIVSEAWQITSATMEGFQGITPSGGWQTMTKFGLKGMFNHLDRFFGNGLKTDQLLVRPNALLAGTATHYLWAGSYQPGEGCKVGEFDTSWYTNRVTGQ